MFPNATANKSLISGPLELSNETFGGSLIMMTFLTDYSAASIPTLLIDVINVKFVGLDFINK